MITFTVSQDPLPLTFGIEIEHLLAFHTCILYPHLQPETRIIKQLPEHTRIDIRQVTNEYSLTRPLYLGWALTEPSVYPSVWGHDWRNQCLQDYGCRGYADEVLHMEAKILREKGLDVIVHKGKGKIADFDRWHLTTDTSLVSALPEELAAVIGVEKAACGEWDSGPVELVSRVLSVDNPSSYAEIGAFLAALNPAHVTPQQRFFQAFARENRWCGLHVHIGLPPSSFSPSSPSLSASSLSLSPPSSSYSSSYSSSSSSSSSSFSSYRTQYHHRHKEQPTFSLSLLQHLAYITVIYEPVLSSLHPKHRRPGHPDTEMDLGSCRSAFYEEPDFSSIDWAALDVDTADEEDWSWGNGDGEQQTGAGASGNRQAKKAPWARDGGCYIASPVAGKFPTPPPPPAASLEEDLAFEARLRRKARKVVFQRGMTLERRPPLKHIA
ncbi:MAG: hypothetical protein Q9202_006757 [Teloschistes flavicans]